MIKVIITDDHPIVRKGIRQILEDDKYERFGVIEEAGDGSELLQRLDKEEFDLVLLDISLPGRSGLELLSDIRKLKPKVHVLVLSIYPEEQYAIRALKLGASGYLNKASAPDELISAIIKAFSGGKYVSSTLAQKITLDILEERESPLHEKLSARELEVLTLLSSGFTLSKIADELSLSPKTISTYRERILEKLNLKTTSDIIRYAIKEGMGETGNRQ